MKKEKKTIDVKIVWNKLPAPLTNKGPKVEYSKWFQRDISYVVLFLRLEHLHRLHLRHRHRRRRRRKFSDDTMDNLRSMILRCIYTIEIRRNHWFDPMLKVVDE